MKTMAQILDQGKQTCKDKQRLTKEGVDNFMR